METKANPRPDGCLARALPDEPFLVLLARDQCAPDVIRFWADQRAQLAVEQADRRQDADQLTEALETADAMEEWRRDNDGRWRLEHPTGLPIVWPERLTEALRFILGRPNFMCGSLAHGYQALGEFVGEDGEPLNKRAEDEQAFVIHRFVTLAMLEPNDWKEAINREVRRLTDALALSKPEEPEHG